MNDTVTNDMSAWLHASQGVEALALALRALKDAGRMPYIATRDPRLAGNPAAAALVRAVVSAHDTGGASALLQSVLGSVIDALRPASVLAQIPGATDVPTELGSPSVRYPRLTAAAGSAGFVAEGAPLPIASGTFDSVMLPAASKAAVGVLATNELLARAGGAEFFAQALLRQLAEVIDRRFLSNAAATTAAPAGILSGIAATAPGASAAADVATLWAALANAGADMASAVWICDSVRFGKLASVAAGGALVFPSVAASGTLFGAPLIQSTACDVTLNSGGAAATGSDLILLAGSDLLRGLAVDPTGISVSDSAAVHADSAPSADIGGAATPVTSAWQRDMSALSATALCRWALLHAASVAWMDATAAW